MPLSRTVTPRRRGAAPYCGSASEWVRFSKRPRFQELWHEVGVGSHRPATHAPRGPISWWSLFPDLPPEKHDMDAGAEADRGQMGGQISRAESASEDPAQHNMVRGEAGR